MRDQRTPSTPNAVPVEVPMLLASAVLACTTAPAEPTADPHRPAVSAQFAPIYLQDDRGTWRTDFPSDAPTLLVPDRLPAQLYPSPWLDKLAVVRPGGGTEIYARDGQLFGWIPTDKFAGWATDESVIADMAKWDVAGHRLRDYAIPPEGTPPETRPFPVGPHSVSPDGRWLAVTRDHFGFGNGPGVVFVATSDGAVGGTASAAGLWTRDGTYVSVVEHDIAFTRPGEKTTTHVTTTIAPCALQPWLRPGQLLAWTWRTVEDYGICTTPFVVALATGEATPLPQVEFALPTNLARPRNFAYAPDSKWFAFAPQGGGIVAMEPDGTNRQALASGHPVTEVAWDSRNPDAPQHDPAVKPVSEHPAPPDDPLPVPPGPPLTPPSSNDCRQGRWYRRTPSKLPANWPSPRSNSAGAFDSKRGVFVVDGGVRVSAESTTWEWDGRAGTWKNRSEMRPGRPLPRFGHAFVYDAKRSVFVLLGGRVDTQGAQSSTWWDWDPVSGTWTALDCDLLTRDFGMAAYDPARDAIWALDDFRFGSLFPRASCAPGSFRGPPGNSMTIGAKLAFDAGRGRAYLLGHRDFGHGVWSWDGTTWTWRDAMSGPGLREHSNVAFDDDRGRLMLFSGFEPVMDASGNVTALGHPADLWEWNPDDGAWTRCGAGPDGPPAIADGVMAWDPGRHALILFGGTAFDARGDTIGERADVWEWAIP